MILINALDHVGGLFQETLIYDIIWYVYVKLCTDFLLVGYNYVIKFCYIHIYIYIICWYKIV